VAIKGAYAVQVLQGQRTNPQEHTDAWLMGEKLARRYQRHSRPVVQAMKDILEAITAFYIKKAAQKRDSRSNQCNHILFVARIVEYDKERAVRKVAVSDKTRTAQNDSKVGQWFELIDLG
jgi:hypothetical protein